MTLLLAVHLVLTKYRLFHAVKLFIICFLNIRVNTHLQSYFPLCILPVQPVFQDGETGPVKAEALEAVANLARPTCLQACQSLTLSGPSRHLTTLQALFPRFIR